MRAHITHKPSALRPSQGGCVRHGDARRRAPGAHRPPVGRPRRAYRMRSVCTQTCRLAIFPVCETDSLTLCSLRTHVEATRQTARNSPICGWRTPSGCNRCATVRPMSVRVASPRARCRSRGEARIPAWRAKARQHIRRADARERMCWRSVRVAVAGARTAAATACARTLRTALARNGGCGWSAGGVMVRGAKRGGRTTPRRRIGAGHPRSS